MRHIKNAEALQLYKDKLELSALAKEKAKTATNNQAMNMINIRNQNKINNENVSIYY